MIELLCIDVDGTLLDSRKKLPERNIEAVNYALKKGVKVAIASGRSLGGIRQLLAQLGIGNRGVCLNGGLIVYDKVIHKAAMEEASVMKIIDLSEKYGSQIFLSAADFNLTNGGLSQEVKELVEKGSLRSDYRFCKDYKELRAEAHRCRNEILKAAIKEINEANSGQLKQELTDLDLFQVAKSDDYFIDINPRASNKGTGVRFLAEYLSIPMEHVMCIGDNENDIEMVETAGIGIAMGNAVKKVKAAASYVTLDNDQMGVAEAIYKFI